MNFLSEALANLTRDERWILGQVAQHQRDRATQPRWAAVWAALGAEVAQSQNTENDTLRGLESVRFADDGEPEPFDAERQARDQERVNQMFGDG